jgi:hypothetical protein
LVCSVVQTDDEGNDVVQQVSTFLRIQAQPEEPERTGLSLGIIGVIASVCFLFLMVLLVIIFLWRTHRLCFQPEPRTVFIEAPRPGQGSTGRCPFTRHIFLFE